MDNVPPRPKETGLPNPHERFTALYNTYQARVYGYAVSRAGHQLAEEVVSETFLVAWRRLDDIPDHAQLQWLFRVARNILDGDKADHHRGVLRPAAGRARTILGPYGNADLVDRCDRIRLDGRTPQAAQHDRVRQLMRAMVSVSFGVTSSWSLLSRTGGRPWIADGRFAEPCPTAAWGDVRCSRPSSPH
ncbi:RNA polymerase sigma factor [[Actinomadura] parvosata]|uniref:RNA polymerase sigma factor n=1 Tax=[Actinomadura] parvosata TaxID=1955412 RepID=UPI00406CE6D9